MIDVLNHSGQSVPVIHAQGDARYEYLPILDELLAKPCSVPDWVGVVSCCNRPMLPQAVLIKQLEANAIPVVNPAAAQDEWANRMKPGLIIQAIESIKHPYVLVLDALDVALNGHFVNAVFPYMDYNKPVLFGATRNNYPDIIIDKVHDRDWRGEFRYLNAGTAFGPREAVLTFYRLVEDVDAEGDREQILVRSAFAKCQTWVEFDWRCAVFQTLARAQIESDGEAIRVS